MAADRKTTRQPLNAIILAALLAALTAVYAGDLFAAQDAAPLSQAVQSEFRAGLATVSGSPIIAEGSADAPSVAPAAISARSPLEAQAGLAVSAAHQADAITLADVWRSQKPWIVVVLALFVLGVLLLLALLERHRRIRGLWSDMRDRLERRNADLQQVADLNRHFELFLTHSTDFIYLKDSRRRYVFASESIARATGRDGRKSLVGRRDEDIYPADIAKEYAEQETELFSSGKAQVDQRRRYKRSDGTTGWLSTHNWPVLSQQGGRVLGLFGVCRDVTDIHENECQLERAANYDWLTGLPNRGLFFDRLRQAMAAVERRGGELAVVYVDVDKFKQVNDNYGHAVGDALLVRFSALLSSQLRRSDTVARLGGDEFVLLLADLTSRQECLVLLDRVLFAVARPQLVADVSLQVTASAGLVFYGGESKQSAELLLSQADEAMYQAKQGGRNRYRVLDEREKGERYPLAECVARGIDRREFELYFQPIIDMRDGSLVGVEALLRWSRDDGEVLLPDEFLPLLSDQPQTADLSRWVLREALRQQQIWKEQDLLVPVHVNVSASDLGQIGFLSRLEADIRQIRGPEGALMILEVPENAALADMKTVNHVIEVCESLGVGFAIDDFGTGYSSLSHVRELAASTVKIDRRFITSMQTSRDGMSLVSGILALASAFDRCVIAEGVESVEQGQFLLDMGCHFAQGFAIARPMPADGLQEWLREWKADSRWTSAAERRVFSASLKNSGRRPEPPVLEVVR